MAPSFLVDGMILIVVALYAMDGIRRGFILSLLEACGFVVSLLVALMAYAPLAHTVVRWQNIPQSFANALSFFVLWVFVGGAYIVLVRHAYHRIPPALIEHSWNRRLGFIPALFDAFLLALVLLPLIVALPLPAPIKSAVLQSKIGAPITRTTSLLDQRIEAVFSPAVRDGLSFLTIHPGSDEAVPLRFKSATATIDESAEVELFKLVNEERKKQGLHLLTYNAKLRDLARYHAEDMLKNGYFSHISPDGKTPANRADMMQIAFVVLGENLALAPDVQMAHDGLMNSPGHRANILSTEYTNLGIGVYDAGMHGKMFVQEFSR